MPNPRRLLIVATEAVPDAVLRAHVRELGDPGDFDVRVVSPSSKVSPLQWLVNEEDEARARAAGVASQTARAIEPEADAVDQEVGDVDPLQAAEDALRTFDADELIVVVAKGEQASWLERASVEDGFERFGRPVSYLTVDG